MKVTEKPTIAFVVYSRNEADLLEGCLERATGFDEVIVCDMQSTDATAQVAARYGTRYVAVPDARVVESVRQHGLDAATTEWVLFVDADERPPEGFAGLLRDFLRDADGVAGVRLRYRNVAFGVELRHTLTGMRKAALLEKVSTTFPPVGRAHVPPVVAGRVVDAPLEVPPILHLNFRTVDQTSEKYLRYAHDIGAPRHLATPLGALRFILRATVFSGTWRDGRAGFVVSFLDAVGYVYAALLDAERRGALVEPFDERTSRVLGALTGVHHALIEARARLRSLSRRGRTS